MKAQSRGGELFIVAFHESHVSGLTIYSAESSLALQLRFSASVVALSRICFYAKMTFLALFLSRSFEYVN